MRIFNTEVKWAFYYLLASLVWVVFEKLLGWHDSKIGYHMAYSFFFQIPTILIYALALREKRETFYDGNMIWMEGLKSGIVLTILMVVFGLPAVLFMSEVISPDYFENAVNHLVEVHDYSMEGAREEINRSKYLVVNSLKIFLLGFLISGVVSIFAKNA